MNSRRFVWLGLLALACRDEHEAEPGPASDPPASQVISGTVMPVPLDAPAEQPLSCGGLLGESRCDPVTAWPCKVQAGESCEFSSTLAAFECVAGPRSAGLCEACGYSITGCNVGFTCSRLNFCVRHCCRDEDCGLGRCRLDAYDQPSLGAIGYCQDEALEFCLPLEPDIAVEPAADAGDGGISERN